MLQFVVASRCRRRIVLYIVNYHRNEFNRTCTGLVCTYKLEKFNCNWRYLLLSTIFGPQKRFSRDQKKKP